MAVVRMLAALVAVLVVSPCVNGHGFVIYPPSRNSVDRDLPLFQDGKFPLPNGKPGCTQETSVCGCWCTNGTSPCEVAQSCFWFSQGCTIGCPTCDGISARAQKDLCNNGMKAVVCDSRLRTYNMNTDCNSDKDIYKHNPWRAPGTAPIFDVCGRAGGGNVGPNVGAGAAFYVNTTHAKEGDLGSKVLPPNNVGTTWKRGSTQELLWGMRANHGGGYQYRLCPKTQNLTEDCMKQTPLQFAGQQSLIFGNGSKLNIPSLYVYENGTGIYNEKPGYNAWARNPIPDNVQSGEGPSSGGQHEFPPPCNDNVNGPSRGLCSGERPFHVAIADMVVIPLTIPPGDYVMGFRWDCEETAQIWTTCADVSIV
eukprot:m.69995 g.69995  ORF g.69995 m.69995 type:complete len:366 (-) comp12098_c0_seq1:106-1203(-)